MATKKTGRPKGRPPIRKGQKCSLNLTRPILAALARDAGTDSNVSKVARRVFELHYGLKSSDGGSDAST